ncbi:MAG: Uricase [Candidatus Acidoferrum typicum]|nr:Uricase [Candidatus Acidoferrum typicum]
MAIRLAENSYGSSRIHLLRVSRQQGRHDVREIALSIRFEGDFEAAHAQGDNRKILPPDTMKNTVYALARQHSIEPLEDFGLHLIEHFLTYNAQVTRVVIDASESIWTHLPHGGKPHPSAFSRSGDQERTSFLSGTRERTHVRAGIENLLVLKTSNSAFEDFKKDPYTTLQEETDRILSVIINANWLYTEEDVEFGPLWHAVRKTLLEAFAEHHSHSLQHTLYAMGDAILGNFENISEIHLSLPSKHFHLADLAPLGMDNPGTVFLPADEPHAIIAATLKKS